MIKSSIRFIARLVAYPLLFLLFGSYFAAKLGYLNIGYNTEDSRSQESYVNDLLHHELLDAAMTCHELSAKLEDQSAVNCYVGFDYEEKISDESLRGVASEFRLVLKDLTKTVNKISSNVNSPKYSIKFIKDKLEELKIDVQTTENNLQSDAIDSALNAYVSFAESFKNTLEDRLAQSIIDNQPQDLEDEETNLLVDEEVNKAQQDNLLEVLREIKPSASPDDIKVKKILKAIKAKAENLPSELYRAIQDYRYWVLEKREKEVIP